MTQTPFAPANSPAQTPGATQAPEGVAQNAVQGVAQAFNGPPAVGGYTAGTTTATVNPAGYPTPNSPAEQIFTKADVEALLGKARQEEKDKLYGRIEEQSSTLSELQQYVKQQQDAETERQRQVEEAQKAAEREKMTAQQLVEAAQNDWKNDLAARETAWKQELAAEREAREADKAVFEKERLFNELREYAQSAYESNSQEIAPELVDWITGNSKEEIDAAVDRAKQTTAKFVASLQQEFPGGLPVAQQAPPQQMAPTGVSVAAGPSNMDPMSQQTLTPDTIRNMTMEQYAQNRSRLLGRAGAPGQGLYG